MRAKSAPTARADVIVARLAAGRHGVLTLSELMAAGLAREAVRRRVAAGYLHRIHHGVYAVGHRGLSREGRWLAATLACGPAALLSHRSAAVLWKLLAPVGGRVHVTVPGRAGRARRPGIRIHRPRHFDETLVTVVDGIRVTTVERTLLDLRGSVPASVVRRAARQAEYMGILRDRAGSDSTRSDLERSFLALCRHHRIPRPEVNVQIGNYTVDFLWRSHGIVIETDGYAAHRGRQAFRDDRDRDLDLATLGLTVHRIADSRIANDPARVAVIVRRLLKLSAPPTGGAPKAR